MALVPANFSSSWRDPSIGARELFNIASWIYRRCKEIIDEPRIDAVKMYDLIGNCVRFRNEADLWINAGAVTEVLAELVRLTQASGKGNVVKPASEISNDYVQLYDAAGVFITWANGAVPRTGMTIPGAVVNVFRDWPETSLGVTVDKTAGVMTQVNTLFAVFA